MSKASAGGLAAHLFELAFGQRILPALAERRRVRLSTRALSRLDDYMLKDIGLTRADIISAARRMEGRRD